MTDIRISDIRTLPATLELGEFGIIPWARPFHLHPCEAMQDGVFICGHAATCQARVECEGCGQGRHPAFLCDVHKSACDGGRIVYHLDPCGEEGFSVILHDVERIE
jgi:hypothetical protein